MDNFILWCGFAGAWLLVAGPIYQAALELKDQDIETDRIRAVGAQIEQPPKVSAWWWLLPPIKYILEHRRSQQYRQAHIAAMSPEDVEAFVAFINKATAWLFVAGGGALLALKETFELTRQYHWHLLIFWLVVISMSLLSICNTIVRIIRSQKVLQTNKSAT